MSSSRSLTRSTAGRASRSRRIDVERQLQPGRDPGAGGERVRPRAARRLRELPAGTTPGRERSARTGAARPPACPAEAPGRRCRRRGSARSGRPSRRGARACRRSGRTCRRRCSPRRRGQRSRSCRAARRRCARREARTQPPRRRQRARRRAQPRRGRGAASAGWPRRAAQVGERDARRNSHPSSRSTRPASVARRPSTRGSRRAHAIPERHPATPGRDAADEARRPDGGRVRAAPADSRRSRTARSSASCRRPLERFLDAASPGTSSTSAGKHDERHGREHEHRHQGAVTVATAPRTCRAGRELDAATASGATRAATRHPRPRPRSARRRCRKRARNARPCWARSFGEAR